MVAERIGMWAEQIFRAQILFLYRITGKLEFLCSRASITEIGLTGYKTPADDEIAKGMKIEPLNRFEQWLLKPLIEAEQVRRRENFRQIVSNITGDDPNEI